MPFPLSIAQLAGLVAITYSVARSLGWLFKIAVVVRDAVKHSEALNERVENHEVRISRIEGGLGLAVPA